MNKLSNDPARSAHRDAPVSLGHLLVAALGLRSLAPRLKNPGGATNERLRKDERDIAVLSGKLPNGADELLYVSEYRLSSWLTGPGR